jgi:hypothetical protein
MLPTATAVSASWVLEMYVNGLITNYSSSQIFAAGDPATATLTFTDYRIGVFRFTLSTPIPTTDVNITNAYVTGYVNTDCSDTMIIESDDSNGTMTIPAGSTSVSKLGKGIDGLTSTSKSYKRGSTVTINGYSYSNGAKFYIGSTYVTLVIDTSCDYPYSS